MISTKQWGEHTLRIAQFSECEMILLDDLAQALEMSDVELVSKMRSDFVIVYYVKDDPNLEDGGHFFLTRNGVYQALWLAKTEEALDFQKCVSTLIRLHFIGPASKSGFDFLDSFVPKIFRKESK